MARKEASSALQDRILNWRFAVRAGLLFILLMAVGYAWNKTEQFLIRDARFAIALPDYGVESDSVQVFGLQYTSRIAVLRVFAPDFGRSLYLLPVQDRQKQLLDIEWIKDATVSRVWPNGVIVQVHEREAVAFLNLATEQRGVQRIALIDSDGKILPPPAHASFNLPVARGIGEEDAPSDRRSKIRRLITLMKDVGPLGDRVSEVNVADPEDLRVTTHVDGRSIVLLLGDRNFQKRMQNFVDNYPRIHERLSSARTLDLRLEDRITAVEGSSGSE